VTAARPRRAVFLDRDGTLIEDVGYPRDPAAVAVLDGAVATLRELRQAGFALVVVSNQSGLARGLITPSQAAAVHDRFVSVFAAAGVRFDAVVYCPHGPADGCDCRKPAPGMLLDTAAELDLDLAGSFMVGDKASDIEAGRRAGCRTILIENVAGANGAAQGTGDAASNWSAVGTLILDATPA
jgi:D-glycero-D-manno-heptose 1,7-bisphosphate phosphatase